MIAVVEFEVCSVFFLPHERGKASRLRWAGSSSRVILGLQCIHYTRDSGFPVTLFPPDYFTIRMSALLVAVHWFVHVHSFIFSRSSLCCGLDLIHMPCE